MENDEMIQLNTLPKVSEGRQVWVNLYLRSGTITTLHSLADL